MNYGLAGQNGQAQHEAFCTFLPKKNLLGDYRLLVLHSFRLNCPPLLSSSASSKLTQRQAHVQSPLVRCPSIAEPIGFTTFFTFSTRLRFGIASDTAVFL